MSEKKPKAVPKKVVKDDEVDLSVEVLNEIVKQDNSQPGTRDRNYRK